MTAGRVGAIRTRRIRLGDEEQRLVDRHLEVTGEVEATFLKLALMRGVQVELRERALMAFLSGTPSSVAAQMAAIDHRAFLDALIQRGIPTDDDGPDDMLVRILRTIALGTDEGS
jgi:hypothetical protein